MKNNSLFALFIEELADMYDSENQIVHSLPKLIRSVSLPDLKEALHNHLKETEHQVERIEEIFHILEIQPFANECEAMVGLLKEANDIIKNKSKSPLLDAAIISAAQKVEHYEIASYGSLRSFAEHLNLDSEIVDLIQDTLDEEGSADKKLTKIAEGSFFSSGVNKRAAEAVTSGSRRARR